MLPSANHICTVCSVVRGCHTHRLEMSCRRALAYTFGDTTPPCDYCKHAVGDVEGFHDGVMRKLPPE